MYFIFTKKALAVFLCVIVIVVALFSRYVDVNAEMQKNANTHKKRIDFLASIGCDIYDEKATTKEIIIPIEFSDVYKIYNELQKQGGYDLTLYKGEKCKVFTYRVLSFEPFGEDDFANANLIVYNGRIIGGDVSSAEIDGKMYPLKRYEKTKT